MWICTLKHYNWRRNLCAGQARDGRKVGPDKVKGHWTVIFTTGLMSSAFEEELSLSSITANSLTRGTDLKDCTLLVKC